MSNLLTPPGLLRVWTYPRNSFALDRILETMPCRPGAWIKSKEGARRLQPDEVTWGLGLSKDPLRDTSLDLIERSTSLFHWEALSESLQRLKIAPSLLPDMPCPPPDLDLEVAGNPEVPEACLLYTSDAADE